MTKFFLNPKSLIKTKNVKIGVGTRINGEILIHGKDSVSIGNYCAFGYGIKIISTNHNTSYANQQLFLQRKIGSKELEYSKKRIKEKYSIKIGNNVWIGNNAIITSGVTIGDGAVIGAGSVVTKNLEPFTINVGNPCKKKKFRFNKLSRDYLKKICWWNWSFKKIKKNKLFFNINFEKLTSRQLKNIKIN